MTAMKTLLSTALVTTFAFFMTSSISVADSTSISPTPGLNNSLLRYTVNFVGPNLNSNSENQQFLQTQAGGVPIVELPSDTSAVTMNFSNGQNYVTVPYASHFYIHVDATTYNNNTGSGEWNDIYFAVQATQPGGEPQTICIFNVIQQGGGSNYGGQYVYFNYVNCDKQLSKGTQLSVNANVMGSGTVGPNVYVMGGTLAIQTMPF